MSRLKSIPYEGSQTLMLNTHAQNLDLLHMEFDSTLKKLVGEGCISVERDQNGRICITIQSSLLFFANDFRITREGSKLLESVAETLLAVDPVYWLNITCHTCPTEYGIDRLAFVDGWNLSSKRSGFVKRWFWAIPKFRGVHTYAEGVSCANPKTTGVFADAKRCNERIEIHIG